MTDALVLETESIRQSFRDWHAEQESLDAQLAESLSALAAYQSHLDAWQQRLASLREELKAEREQLRSDRSALESSKAELQAASTEYGTELAKAREELAALNVSLAQCQEERDADQRRCTELTAERDAVRTKVGEFETQLAEFKRAHELEREQWATELQRVREELQSRLPAAALPSTMPASASPPQQPREKPRSSAAPLSESPVLESIMQQFGKLRQQRAIDREALRKTR